MAHQSARSRRAARIVLMLALTMLVLSLALRFALQSQRATQFLLQRAGASLGLEITASGVAEYRLRGTPALVVRDVVAREPGAPGPLLRADRIFLSLPWSTLRARGKVLDATRIELDAPVVDLPALQHWLAQRPPSTQATMPSLSEGLRIRDGVLDGGTWRLESLQADLPSFTPGTASPLRLRGAYPEPAFAFDLSGPFQWNAGTWRLAPARLSLRGHGDPASDPIPAVDALGELALGKRLELRLEGDIATWPAGWPALPDPLGASASPMSFELEYGGALDLGDIAALQLQRDDTRFEGNFRLYEVLAWIDAGGANPLPPIEGSLRTPRLDIAGAQLHGVEISIDGTGIDDD